MGDPGKRSRATNMLHDRAKRAAIRDLIEMYRGTYEVLRQGYLEEMKREAGWTDARAEANRRRAADGR